MAGGPQTVVFLHGLGADPTSWDAQIAALPDGFQGFAPEIPGLWDEDAATFSLTGAATAIRQQLDSRSVERAHLCGLSLGAMVATQFAIDHPERVASLVLSGGQVRPNAALMKVQKIVIRLLPQRVVAPAGPSKQRMLAVLGSVAGVDFRPGLRRISAPTLVLCGAKDRPNLSAAHELAGAIPNALLHIVSGAGHEWNTQLPNRFSAELNAFLARATGGGVSA